MKRDDRIEHGFLSVLYGSALIFSFSSSCILHKMGFHSLAEWVNPGYLSVLSIFIVTMIARSVTNNDD